MSARRTLLSGVAVFSAFVAAATADVFTDAAKTPVWQGELDHAQIRMRMVEFDASEILSARSDEVTLSLFDDAVFVGATDMLKRRDGENFSWRGRTDDPSQYAIVVQQNGETAGFVRTDGRVFEILPSGNGVSRIVEVHVEAQLPCGIDAAEIAANPMMWNQNIDDLLGRTVDAEMDAETADSPERGAPLPTFDQLVAYTPNALNWVGGSDSGMFAFIEAAIEDMNTILSNSGINMTTRAVFKHPLTENETGSGGGDRNAFRINGDGKWDEVHQLRDDFGADLCHILVRNSDVCGIAAMIYRRAADSDEFAFCLTAVGCVSGQTFTHEVGHCIGCAHDINNAGGVGGAGTFSYSFGWRDPIDASWRTNMSYAPGSRVSYFSTPDFDHPDGQPLGDPVWANNANTIELNIPFITTWRASVGLAPTDVSADVAPAGITIGWTPVAQATSYQIWRGATPDPLMSFQRGVSSGTDWLDDNVNPGQTYYYFTKARFADGGISPFSDGVMATAVAGVAADLSGDGNVDATDIAIMLAAWGSINADLSGDGTTDSTDLAILLAAWG